MPDSGCNIKSLMHCKSALHNETEEFERVQDELTKVPVENETQKGRENKAPKKHRALQERVHKKTEVLETVHEELTKARVENKRMPG